MTVPSHLIVDMGAQPGVVDHDKSRTSVRFENVVVTMHGTMEARRALVRELAECLGIPLEPDIPPVVSPFAAELADASGIRS